MTICLGHVADNPPDACFDFSLTAQPAHADDFTSHSKMCDSNVLSKCKQKYASPTPNKSLTHRDDAMAWRETGDRDHQEPNLLIVSATLQDQYIRSGTTTSAALDSSLLGGHSVCFDFTHSWKQGSISHSVLSTFIVHLLGSRRGQALETEPRRVQRQATCISQLCMSLSPGWTSVCFLSREILPIP